MFPAPLSEKVRVRERVVEELAQALRKSVPRGERKYLSEHLIGGGVMHSDSIRFALATIFVSLCEATALATGKPIGELSGHLMREIADGAEPEAARLCAFLADCAHESDRGRGWRLVSVMPAGNA